MRLKRALDENWPLDIIRALRFRDADCEGLERLARTDWKSLVSVADAAHLTVPLATCWRSHFPIDGQRYLDDVLERNAVRHARLIAAYGEIAAAFTQNNVRFVVLKGLSHWPYYVDDPQQRYQSDMDFYCPPESLDTSREVLAALGYESVHPRDVSPVDHLPVMIRKTGWLWRGDYYDPDRPSSVEVHFQLWDAATEGFGPEGLEAFWRRRGVREIHGLSIPTLSPVDGLSYACMHLVRHLLRGDLQIRHVYELAHFLERSRGDEAFWAEWGRRPGERRVIEAIAFRLAMEWFGCEPHEAARETIARMPDAACRWFEVFRFSPAVACARPNKDELWLHLCLVQDPAVRRRIVMRRIFPMRRQRVVLDAHLPGERNSMALQVRRMFYEVTFLGRRLRHHLSTIGPLVRSGIRWRRAIASV
jgi:hypothetical protein